MQEDPSTRVAVLSIKAAGAGLTLTAASTVIFGELSWTPGDVVQVGHTNVSDAPVVTKSPPRI